MSTRAVLAKDFWDIYSNIDKSKLTTHRTIGFCVRTGMLRVPVEAPEKSGRHGDPKCT